MVEISALMVMVLRDEVTWWLSLFSSSKSSQQQRPKIPRCTAPSLSLPRPLTAPWQLSRQIDVYLASPLIHATSLLHDETASQAPLLRGLRLPVRKRVILRFLPRGFLRSGSGLRDGIFSFHCAVGPCCFIRLCSALLMADGCSLVGLGLA
jgi:hypothetical protein